MIKKLLRILFLFAIFCQVFTKASAQYAIGGTAGSTLVHSVYWLTWDSGAAGSQLIQTPAGYNNFNIVNGTYVWQFSPTVRITAIISNEVSTTNNMQAYTPGNYSGDGLNYIYSGNNLPAPNSRGVANSGLLIVQGTVTFNIDLKVSILINGVYTNVTYPGMVIGDAESISSVQEYISGTTPNPIAWQLLNKRSSGTTGDDHYLLQLSNNGTSFKLFVDQAPGNLGIQAVMFAHGASNLQNVSMKGEGNTALAIGFVLPFDLGDAPLSYGVTGNYIDQFAITDYFPGDNAAGYPVVNYQTTPLIPQATVYIGTNNVDPDGNAVTTIAANNDDTTNVNDENTIIPNSLPNIKVNQATDVVLTIPATNTKTVPATLYGWMDFNNDGVFTSDEVATATVPANTTASTNFTLTFPNATFKSKIVSGPLYLRLKITTTSLIDDATTTAVDERSVSFAADGETEDYKLNNILGVNISGKVVNDGNGGTDGAISGNPVQLVAGHQLYAYLVSNNAVVATTQVAADGSYSFTANNGNYIVAISTNVIAIGGTLTQVAANLPAGFVPSGAAYGTNNAFSNVAVQAGAPNLQLQANTPGTGLDITGVNFGINDAPAVIAHTATTNPGIAVTINVPQGATDADGTITAGSVLLTDPADGTEKTSVTVANQGTFVVNTSTGLVTFTPLASFSGTTTPLSYTIKDNFGTESPTATLTVTVKPVGVADVATTPIRTAVVINVKANDGTGSAGATVVATNGANGVTNVDASGNVTYTPVASFIGTDTFTYTLVAPDGTSSDPITVTVNVKPAGQPDVASTLVNTPVTTNVKANDGVSGTNATVTPTFGAHGTTSVDASGNVIYTPVSDFTGTDTYTYTLTTPSGAVSSPITVTVTVMPSSPSMSLTKAANNTVANVGDVINYTIVAKNTGNVALTNVVVADTGADAGSISPASVATLAIGASTTFTAKHTVVQADVTAGRFSNTASVTANDPSGNPVSTPQSDDPNTTTANDPTVSIIAPPGVITLSKTGVVTNNIITFTFTIKNTGPGILTNVALTDAKLNLTNQAVTIPAGGLPSGSTASYTATYTLSQADKDAGTLTNTATVSSNDPSGNNITATSSVTLTYPKSPIANNDAATASFNTPVVIPILNNDNSGTTTFNLQSVQINSNPAHGGVVANSDGTVTYTPATGYTGSDTFTYQVKDSFGYLTNTATVTVTVVSYVATMSLTKVANNSVAVAGNIINYTITVKNTGNVALTNILITDAGVDGGTVTPASIATLAVGATATVTGAHTVTAADVSAGSYSNQAGVTATDPNGNTASTPKSDDPGTSAVNDPTTVTITPPGTVSLTKAGVFSGNTITYTFTIKNTGNTTLSTITLTDAELGLSNVAVPVTGGNLAAGATVTYTSTYTLTQADKDAGTVANTATVSSKDPAGNTVTNTSSVTVTVPKSPVAVNDAVVTNFNTPAVISVLANDNPGNTTFNVQSVQIITAPVHGTAVPNSDGTVTYTPTTNYTGTDSFTYQVKDSYGYMTNVATDNITVNSFVATMSLTKVATSGYINAGDIINYTLTVTNTGNVALTNIKVADVGADAGSITPTTVPSLAIGASVTVTAKHTATQNDVNTGSYSNQASVTALDPNGNPASNPKSDNPNTPAANDPTVVTVTPPGAISLSETGTFSGNTITYAYTIKNTGTVTLTSVKLSDAKVGLSNVVVTIPSGGLPAGSTATYNAVYTLTQADKDLGTVTNNPSVSGVDPSNNPVSSTTTLTTTVPKSPVAVNDGATTNLNTPVSVPVLTNDNPGSSTFNVQAVQVITPPAHGTTVVNTDGTVTYTPATGYSGSDSFTYKAQDAYGYTTNVATATITINSFTASMSLTKKANNTASNVGDVITYTLVVTNTGTSTLTNVKVTDAGADAGSITPANIASLAPGISATVTASHTVTQANVTAGSYSNQAAVTATDPSGNPVTNPKSDDPTTAAVNDPTVVTISPQGAINLTEAGVFSSNTITYTYTIKNTGPVTLTSVKLTDSKVGLTNTVVPLPTGSLTAGSTVTYTAVYTLTQADKDLGSVTNNPSVTGVDPANRTVTSTTTLTTTVPKSPVAVNDAATAGFNTPVIIPVLNNDNPGSSTFNLQSVQIVTQPTHGTVVTNTDGTVTYTPANGFSGADAFTYKVQDAYGYVTNVATVNVTVASFTASMSLTKTANNGASAVGDIINYTLVVTNTGTATLNNIVVTDAGADAGSITPATITSLAPGLSATVTAKHTVTQANVTAGSFSNQASVTAKDPNGATVTNPKSDDPTTPAVNDPTVVIISAPGVIKLTEQPTFSGNTVTYVYSITNAGTVPLTSVKLTDIKVGLAGTTIPLTNGSLAAGATVTYTAVYTLTQADKDAGAVTNNPSVTAIDPASHTASSTTTATVPVAGSPTATADNAQTGIGQPVVIPVLNNDNSGNTTFNIGSVQVAGQPSHGTTTVNSDGTITYTPVAGYIGADSFTYNVKDSYGYITNTAIVTVAVSTPGTISLAKVGVVNVNNNTITYTFTIKNTGQVPLTNVTLTDSKLSLSGVTVTIPIGGIPVGGTATYTSVYTLLQADRDAAVVNNTASVSSKDPLGNTITASATATTTVPASPVASNITTVVQVNQPVVISVIPSGNAGSSTFDPTSIQIVTPPQHGTVTVNANGTITYTPTAGYTGADSFTYRLKDANGYFTNIATVTINDTATVVGLKVPSLFTPNFDGVNDYFVIKGLENYPKNELVIVNRWGNEVFRQTNYQQKWFGDGLNEGTYYYILTVKNPDGSVFTVVKGFTTLIKKFKN